MGLSSRIILDIVELVFYGPALLCATMVIKKHGTRRQAGWLYLAILAIIRILGASTGIAANSDTSRVLIETSDIAYSVGLSPLLLAWLGIIKRVTEGMRVHQFQPKLINIVTLPILVGLVLSIFGGTKLFDTKPVAINTGVTYTKAGIVLLVVALLALSAIIVFSFTRIRHVLDVDKRLLLASAAVIPFLFVRVRYSIVVDFDRGSSIFGLTSDRNAAVVVQAIMSAAMEFIVVSIFLTAGFITPAVPHSMVQSEHNIPASEHEPQQRYAQGCGGENSQGATYALTSQQPIYTGYKGGREDGTTGGS